MKQALSRNKMIRIVLFISLFASVTNFLPLSVSFCLLLLLVPVITRRIPTEGIFLPLLCLYIVFLISVLIYHPQSLINPTFYRRDGNFFVTFLPLLILVRQRRWFNTGKVVRLFIYFATAINLLCMLVPRLGFNPNHFIFIEGATVNHFLFVAHNAAGGFIAVLLGLNIGFFLAGKSDRTKKRMLICCLINLAALVDSGSRGTWIAFAIAIALFLIMKRDLSERKYRIPYDQMIFLLVLVTMVLLITIVSDEKLYDFVLSIFHITKRTFTISIRLSELWPKAIRMFFSSPLIGTGYGSFNDEPENLFVIVKGLLALNQPTEYIFNSSHAHNTFLHVLAETGIVGLFFLIFLLHRIWNSIMRINNKPLRYGLYIGLCVNVFSSFTEHRLFTPSQMIPFVLVLGMILSEERSEKFRQRIAEIKQ